MLWAVGKMRAAGSCLEHLGSSWIWAQSDPHWYSTQMVSAGENFCSHCYPGAILGDVIICSVPADTAPSWQERSNAEGLPV